MALRGGVMNVFQGFLGGDRSRGDSGTLNILFCFALLLYLSLLWPSRSSLNSKVDVLTE